MLVAVVAFTAVISLVTPAGAGAQTTESASCLAGNDLVSALILVDNPTTDAVAPLVREEAIGVLLTGLIDLVDRGRPVEVAVARMGGETTVVTDWVDLDAQTYPATLAATTLTAPTTTVSLAPAIEASQAILLDRVGEEGCGLTVALPIGAVGFTADEAGELCASGGTIDSLRALPAHLGIITTPTAIADVDRTLLDAVAGTSGSQESCGSVASAGAVIEGSTRAEVLAPVGRMIDGLAGASVTTDETAVCDVFACPEGSTTVTANAVTGQVSIDGVFSGFGYDVVLESPAGDKILLPGATDRIDELSGASITTIWPSRATVSVAVTGGELAGDWTATVIDPAAAGDGTAQWQHAVTSTVRPEIVSVSPTDAGAEASVQVDLFSADGVRIDAGSAPNVVPEGVVIDPITGSSTPIEFGEIVEGSHVGRVQLPADLGSEAEVVVSVAGGESVSRAIVVTSDSPADPQVSAGDSGGSDGLFSTQRLALLGLALVAGVLGVWLVRHRKESEQPPGVRGGAFEIVVGPDGHLSRVVEGRVHPLFFRGPDFSDLPAGNASTRQIQDLEIRLQKAWNPLSAASGHVRSAAGPTAGSQGRIERDGTLVGVVPWELGRSWAFVLDTEATTQSNRNDPDGGTMIRGSLHVFIDGTLTGSNDWLLGLVSDLPQAARSLLEWAHSEGLTDVTAGETPMVNTYAEFASLVTD